MKFIFSTLAFLSFMLLSNAVTSVQGRESVAEMRHLRTLSLAATDPVNTTGITSEEELSSEAREGRISEGAKIGIKTGILGAAALALVAGCFICKKRKKAAVAVAAAATTTKSAGDLEVTTASGTPSSNL